jgi:hypothetical protein
VKMKREVLILTEGQLFRIQVGTKFMSKMLSLRETDFKEDSWTLKEEEMDSKKKRAETILKESMQQPNNELAQLREKK